MKKLLLAGIILISAGVVQADYPKPNYYPKRKAYPRSGYGVWENYYDRGQLVKRQFTYPGKAWNVPPPAFLYYGYPQSGYSYGVGF